MSGQIKDYEGRGISGDIARDVAAFKEIFARDSVLRVREFHCGGDMSVNLDKHSVRLVEEMEKGGYDICLTKVPLRNHCNLSPEAWMAYRRAIVTAIG